MPLRCVQPKGYRFAAGSSERLGHGPRSIRGCSFLVRSKRGQRKLINDIAKITLANATVRSSADPAGRIDFVVMYVP